MAERFPYPFARPLVPRPAAWIGYLEESYDARWYTNRGPVVRRLEARLAADVGGGREVVATASATAGLTAVLLALDVRGPIAVPAFTFPATIAAIELAGCTPVFCDIDPATCELDPDDACRAIESFACVAVLHVRTFGFCHDLAPIEAVADAAGIPLVVDAAAAFGGRTAAGMPAGRAGAAEVFSFHATKVFAVGEGGAVAASPELAERIRHVANFAIDGADVTTRGLNAKMPETTAAIALAVRDELPRHLAVRAQAAAVLGAIAVAHGVALPHVVAGAPPMQCLPMVLESALARTAFVEALAADGIEARSYYCPGMHRLTAWRAAPGAARELPVTDDITTRMVCVGLYSDLVGAELQFFSRACETALSAAVRTGQPIEAAA
ncbi:MAG: dTDP-4-dehydro-6-deoxyglucose aminotransferase [Thermoleophilia bacterium]|nr:dTDP-4-dehydro-6-deoxyglucose aminotransferase [Thermoleophilia bacterium]